MTHRSKGFDGIFLTGKQRTMTNRRDWIVLSLGLIAGAGAASLYWHSSQRHNQFIFDHNLKCQQIGKQFESESSYRAAVVKVSYCPTRNSCIAEVVRPDGGGTNYIVQDLLSGETMFLKRAGIVDDQALKDQEAKFLAACR
jgi:hypothetical protein